MQELDALAKIVWEDPKTKERREFVLQVGATATIGRSSTNDIHIPEQHVSRQHAVINYRDGIFMVNDSGSANGTFVNDQQITEPYPLMAGDDIRLYVPILKFAAADEQDVKMAEETGRFISVKLTDEKAVFIVANGPQEGQTIPLLLDELKVGRATVNATWEIALQDPTVSRPHAKLKHEDKKWTLYDLGSSNGTSINNELIDANGRELMDGDMISFGASIVIFRVGMEAPKVTPAGETDDTVIE